MSGYFNRRSKHDDLVPETGDISSGAGIAPVLPGKLADNDDLPISRPDAAE